MDQRVSSIFRLLDLCHLLRLRISPRYRKSMVGIWCRYNVNSELEKCHHLVIFHGRENKEYCNWLYVLISHQISCFSWFSVLFLDLNKLIIDCLLLKIALFQALNYKPTEQTLPVDQTYQVFAIKREKNIQDVPDIKLVQVLILFHRNQTLGSKFSWI